MFIVTELINNVFVQTRLPEKKAYKLHDKIVSAGGMAMVKKEISYD